MQTLLRRCDKSWGFSGIGWGGEGGEDFKGERGGGISWEREGRGGISRERGGDYMGKGGGDFAEERGDFMEKGGFRERRWEEGGDFMGKWRFHGIEGGISRETV